MRKPRPEDFDPDYKNKKSPIPEEVDMVGVVAIKPKVNLEGNDASEEREPPIKHGSMTPRYHDTTVSRYHDTIVDAIRKSVKQFGKEAATHRFTKEEKESIENIVYIYRKKNIRTSVNEVTRIAINFIVREYEESGKNGILDRVLKALND